MQKIGIPLVYLLSCLKVLQNPFPSVLNPLTFTLCLTLYLGRTLPDEKAGFSLSVLYQCSLGAQFLYCTLVTFSLTTSAPLCIEPLTNWLPT